MDIVGRIWVGLSPGQGAVLASAITMVAALIGVFLGWFLFSGRVKDLETAIKSTETVIDRHKDVTERAFAEMNGMINDQLASFAAQLGKLSGSVADLPISSPSRLEVPEQNSRDNLRESWGRIRNRIEEIASDEKIDGRTRAKYGRIDRRRYPELLDALRYDGRLGINVGFLGMQ